MMTTHNPPNYINNINITFENVTIGQRKNLTKACISCKQRKKKCSGTYPACSFCYSRNQLCIYDIQDKRGPKTKKTKIEDNNNNNNNNGSSLSLVTNNQAQPPLWSSETILWRENERHKSIDVFFELRNWWSYMLDQNALRDPANTECQVQSLMISASISRYNRDKQLSQRFFSLAQSMINTIESPMEYASSMMLMIDYNPSLLCSFTETAFNKLQEFSITKLATVKQKRMYSYINMMYFSCANKMEISDREQLFFKMEKDLLSMQQVEVWDIVFAMLLKVGSMAFKEVATYWDISFLESMKNVQFSKEDINKLTSDVDMILWIVKSNSDAFGFEMYWFFSLKPYLLWKKGEMNAAISETIQYLGRIANLGAKSIFLSDLYGYVIPLLILKEAGMTNMLRQGLDLIAPVAFATDQHDVYASICDYYLPKTIEPPQHSYNSPSPTESSSPLSPLTPQISEPTTHFLPAQTLEPAIHFPNSHTPEIPIPIPSPNPSQNLSPSPNPSPNPSHPPFMLHSAPSTIPPQFPFFSVPDDAFESPSYLPLDFTLAFENPNSPM